MLKTCKRIHFQKQIITNTENNAKIRGSVIENGKRMREMAQICETLYRKIKWKKEKEKRETNLWSEIGSKHRSGFVVDLRIFLCFSLSLSL